MKFLTNEDVKKFDTFERSLKKKSLIEFALKDPNYFCELIVKNGAGLFLADRGFNLKLEGGDLHQTILKNFSSQDLAKVLLKYGIESPSYFKMSTLPTILENHINHRSKPVLLEMIKWKTKKIANLSNNSIRQFWPLLNSSGRRWANRLIILRGEKKIISKISPFKTTYEISKQDFLKDTSGKFTVSSVVNFIVKNEIKSVDDLQAKSFFLTTVLYSKHINLRFKDSILNQLLISGYWNANSLSNHYGTSFEVPIKTTADALYMVARDRNLRRCPSLRTLHPLGKINSVIRHYSMVKTYIDFRLGLLSAHDLETTFSEAEKSELSKLFLIKVKTHESSPAV